ncbi:GHKL domain-containing protein [Butyrivibrio fibrisolvens DSM 3071]|uniref:GHKL domain-containing protein n=2 Tax=Butyrivibrio fibrisolvens TaxID=831 RepID=A0A1M5Q212_BUTFI|nr:GHKL domain-containing protein [Butyrivibrio fibrisolvens DSM 3071]
MAGFDWQHRIAGPVPAFFLVYMILIWILFEISVKEAIIMGMATWLVLSIIEENIIIAIQTKYVIEERRFDGIIMVAILLIIWSFYYIFRNRYNAQAFRMPITVWILLDLIMLLLMAMLSFFTYVIVKNLPNTKMITAGQILLLIGGISIIILLFIFVYFYGTAYEYRIQKEITEMQIRQQREYFERLLEREEETKKFRHDIINDLLELHNYCENHECQQMKQYLEKVTGVVTGISNKSYNVGNDVINTILNYYLIPLKEKYDVEVSGMLSNNISIDDRNLCVICANVIKNAVEAVSKMDEGRVATLFECGKSYLHIQVENTYEGDIEFDDTGIPKTSKCDMTNHGIGMRNVFEMVKKNEGTCRIEAKDGVFKVDIFLKS